MASKTALRPREAAPAVPQTPATTALAKVAQNFTIELIPFPHGAEALVFQRTASTLTVQDVDSHRAGLEELRVGKRLKREVEEHWQKMTRWFDERKRELLTIKNMDLELVEPGLRALSDRVLAYENAERERVRIAQEVERREQERIAQAKRDQDLAELERQAVAAEGASENLSTRELVFVGMVVKGVTPRGAADVAGYKDPEARAALLLATPKIQAAITAQRHTFALRDQAAAVAAKPVEVPQHTTVESRTAKVAGTRTVTTHTGEVLSSADAVAHLLAGGEDAPPSDLFIVDPVKLNVYARALHVQIERWHGVRYVKNETKAG